MQQVVAMKKCCMPGYWDPANMDHASCTLEGLKRYDNIAFPHQYWRKRGYYVPIRLNEKYYNAVSAGGVNASIADMAHYMQILLGNRPDIASDDVLGKVFEPSVEIRNRTHFPPLERYKRCKLWTWVAYFGSGRLSTGLPCRLSE